MISAYFSIRVGNCESKQIKKKDERIRKKIGQLILEL